MCFCAFLNSQHREVFCPSRFNPVIRARLDAVFRKGIRLIVCLRSFQGITLDSFMFTFVA